MRHGFCVISETARYVNSARDVHARWRDTILMMRVGGITAAALFSAARAMPLHYADTLMPP